MCDRNFMLVVFLILKIMILIITPIVLYFLYKKESKVYNLVGGLDIFFILLFIVLRLTGNSCITNSTFSYIFNNGNKPIILENSNTIYESIFSNNQYINMNNDNAYYYSINNDPLRYVRLSCKNDSYMKNYGESITAITTLISNNYNTSVNEIDILKYLDEKKLINCDNGIDFEKALNALQDKYYYNLKEISKSEVNNYVSTGNSVLAETQNKYDQAKNFGCEKDYIIIYNINNDGLYNIINPNDKDYEYFCPDNTIGYGSIIEENQNEKTYTFDEIDSKALRYYVIEVR